MAFYNSFNVLLKCRHRQYKKLIFLVDSRFLGGSLGFLSTSNPYYIKGITAICYRD